MPQFVEVRNRLSQLAKESHLSRQTFSLQRRVPQTTIFRSIF